MKRFFWAVGTTAAMTVACCGGCVDGSGENGEGPKTDVEATALDSGAAALDAGEWTRAFDSFSAAIAADPAAVDAYYGRAAASLALAQDRYRLAQAAATNGDRETGVAEAAKADEHFKQATDDCAKTLELDPQRADAYFIRGVAAQYQGDWNAGLEAFSKCVELDSSNAEAYHRRGEIYDHLGDYMNASVDRKKAAEMGYRDADGEKNASENGAASQDSGE